MEPRVDDPMQSPPRPVDEPLITLRELRHLASYGAWMALLGLGVFGFFQMQAGGVLVGAELATARTLTFSVLALAPMFHSLNARSAHRSAFELGFFSNWRLIGAFAAAGGLQALAIYVPVVERTFGTRPLSGTQLGIAIGLAASVWILGELHKLLRRLLRGRRNTRALPPRRPADARV
jgi:Ca2+-transporting ATPase